MWKRPLSSYSVFDCPGHIYKYHIFSFFFTDSRIKTCQKKVHNTWFTFNHIIWTRIKFLLVLVQKCLLDMCTYIECVKRHKERLEKQIQQESATASAFGAVMEMDTESGRFPGEGGGGWGRGYYKCKEELHIKPQLCTFLKKYQCFYPWSKLFVTFL